MKKNVLALSMAAALAGLTGGAYAMNGTLGGATAGSALTLNGDGIGHALVLPYFTTQNSNSTKINLVNTDQVNGKAVKVRFRGAANSDDIFDFQVFLSPGDVWTASIAQNANGVSQLTTADASCTKPSAAVLNATPFVTARLDPSMTAAQLANGTREGYVEIFNMGDIPKAGVVAATVMDVVGLGGTAAGSVAAAGDNPLYTAIKHVNNVAPCSGAAWTNLDTTNMVWNAAAATATTPSALGLLPPSTGLMGNVTIINIVGAASWTGEAVAIQSTAAGAAAAGNVVYWPQTATAPAGIVGDYTADPLMRAAYVYSNQTALDIIANYTKDTTPAVAAGNYDLPDLSTPYSAAAGVATLISPLNQAGSVTASLAATAATNEFLTDTAIQASTDWVFSMPTRRYSVALDYAAISATDNGKRFSDLNQATGNNQPATAAFGTGYFLPQNTTVVTDTSVAGTNGNGRQICVSGVTYKVFNREESTLTGGTAVVVSPSTPTPGLTFCGEATVLSFNNGGIVAAGTGALKASVAVKDLDVTYRDGWMRLATPSATTTPNGAGSVAGLPVVGASFSRAFAGANSFGATYNHRFAR